MHRRLLGFFLTLSLSGAAAAGLYILSHRERSVVSPTRDGALQGRGVSSAEESRRHESADGVMKFCSSCHKFPPPDTLPRTKWREKVETMYQIVGETKDAPPGNLPPIEDAIAYFMERAPAELPPSLSTVEVGPGPLHLKRIPLKLGGIPPYPGTANLRFCHLYDDKRLDLLLCEMRFGMVMVIKPYSDLATIGLIANVPHPCHAEVVDLDLDGIRDILVADLGTVTPSDVKQGSAMWLRGTRQGAFNPIPLATGLGRVADVQAADFDGDGDLDLVVAVFGWRKVGQILYLENQTADYALPKFVPYELDPRPGAIHVPVVDLNQDGRPDFIALISQHFETVVAFLNRGNGIFEEHEIFTANHPNWGSSGIQVVDLDGDKDLDVLLANGDTLDDLLLKPYHGITWLENRGRFPFVSHRLTDLYGVHYAKAADLDGDGDLDIAASVFLPFMKQDIPQVELIDSIIWLEQRAPGEFKRWSLEASACVHPTLDVGDFDADGDEDIAVGNMTMAKGKDDTLENWVILFQNERK